MTESLLEQQKRKVAAQKRERRKELWRRLARQLHAVVCILAELVDGFTTDDLKGNKPKN